MMYGVPGGILSVFNGAVRYCVLAIGFSALFQSSTACGECEVTAKEERGTPKNGVTSIATSAENAALVALLSAVRTRRRSSATLARSTRDRKRKCPPASQTHRRRGR